MKPGDKNCHFQIIAHRDALLVPNLSGPGVRESEMPRMVIHLDIKIDCSGTAHRSQHHTPNSVTGLCAECGDSSSFPTNFDDLSRYQNLCLVVRIAIAQLFQHVNAATG
jgi:hypothetical protein